MPPMLMEHAVDPKDALLEQVGDLSSIDIFNNAVLVALYVRPQRTKSGLYLTDKYTDEDRIQGKAGLIIKMGPSAFVDESGNWFKDVKIGLHDWVIFRPSDGWSVSVNGISCRLIDDTAIRGRVAAPDMVW